MDKTNKKIGILGGTFDPVHHGHLILADDVRQKFSLDKVVFIPSGMPPHKAVSSVTEAEHRFNMVRIAVSTNTGFEVSRIEIDRSGYTYTIDTLTQLKREYGDDTELLFIIGADVVNDLLTWKNYEMVFGMCGFIAVLRPGFDNESFVKRINWLEETYKAKIYTTDTPLIEISSTIIREKLQRGQSIKYLVPESVEAYVTENGLYT